MFVGCYPQVLNIALGNATTDSFGYRRYMDNFNCFQFSLRYLTVHKLIFKLGLYLPGRRDMFGFYSRQACIHGVLSYSQLLHDSSCMQHVFTNTLCIHVHQTCTQTHVDCRKSRVWKSVCTCTHTGACTGGMRSV